MTQRAYNRRDKSLRRLLRHLDHRTEMKRKAYLASAFAIIAFNFIIAKVVCS